MAIKHIFSQLFGTELWQQHYIVSSKFCVFVLNCVVLSLTYNNLLSESNTAHSAPALIVQTIIDGVACVLLMVNLMSRGFGHPSWDRFIEGVLLLCLLPTRIWILISRLTLASSGGNDGYSSLVGYELFYGYMTFLCVDALFHLYYVPGLTRLMIFPWNMSPELLKTRKDLEHEITTSCPEV